LTSGRLFLGRVRALTHHAVEFTRDRRERHAVALIDPYGEHDFGNFEVAGQKFFFKIDYYDPNLEFGSEDPGDPQKTTRVLTIMLAEEY
jgi:hypothetical protein